MTSTTTRTTLEEFVYEDVVPVKHGSRVLRTRTTLIVKDDCVSVIESEYIIGLTSGGKVWTRWRDMNCTYISYRARGNGPKRLNVYKKKLLRINGGGFQTSFKNETARNFTLYPFDKFPEAMIAIIDLLSRCGLTTQETYDSLLSEFTGESAKFRRSYRVEDEITKCAFPLLRGINERYVPPGLTLGARESTMQDFVRVAFGKKRYRKDLVKACSDAGLLLVAYARDLRQDVPVDWLVDMLKLDISPRADTPPHRYLKKIISRVPMHRRRSFLFDAVTPAPWFMDDIERMIEENNLHHVILESKNFRDLHDKLAAEVRKMKTVNHKVPVTGRAKKYNGAVTDNGLLIVAPEESETINSWGDQMRNCIGSYARRAINGDVFVGGVYSDNKLLANFEISPEGNLRQLLGKHNQKLTKEEQTDILDTLVSVKAIRIDKNTKSIPRAWGVEEYTPPTERETVTQ